jgi:hypothetical protein
MNLKQRIQAFSNLSEYLLKLSENKFAGSSYFEESIYTACYNNPWFTKENIHFALTSIAKSININEIEKWVIKYPSLTSNNKTPERIGIIMAGNLPLVGFHDFFYVLMSGNIAVCKLSSDDKFLLPALAKKLCEFEAEFSDYIHFAENKLENFDKVIATGSNNSSRYFEYYFGKYPNIIRKNRNAVAVLKGDESADELNLLCQDILRYYSKGCRNVSKLLVPQNYKFDLLLEKLAENAELINNSKFINNYDYYKSIYLINAQPFYDNGSIILKEEKLISSPVSVLYFEYYHSIDEVYDYISTNKENIQCIVSSIKSINGCIPLGDAQKPSLSDYADGVDVMDFLLI